MIADKISSSFEVPAEGLAQELGETILVLLRVGRLLAGAGAAAFRVREAMQRTAVALGATRSEFVVMIDALAASVFVGGQFRTQVVRLPPAGVDMNLLCRIELLTHSLAADQARPTAVSLHEHLDALEAAPRVYARWLTIPCLGVACGAFCAAGAGTPLQIAAATFGAALGHSLRLALLSRRVPLVPLVVVCAFLSALGTDLMAMLLSQVSALGRLADGGTREAGIATLASVLYLIPGVPLVTGLIDLVHLDVSAGLTRAAYASVLIGSIAVGMFSYFAVGGLF